MTNFVFVLGIIAVIVFLRFTIQDKPEKATPISRVYIREGVVKSSRIIKLDDGNEVSVCLAPMFEIGDRVSILFENEKVVEIF